MTQQQTQLWEDGPSDAPLPPLVDSRDTAKTEQPMVALYRTAGPNFR